jgi:KipI family sensor histidine kinase inhibitor
MAFLQGTRIPSPQFELREAGDSAMVLALPEQIDPRFNARCISMAQAIRESLGVAIRDVVIGYCTVTVYFDPLSSDPSWLKEQLQSIAGHGGTGRRAGGATVEVPVCYGGEFGPDLDHVAAFGGCSPEEAVARHSGTLYRVYLIGFVPGFAYMATVDPRIAVPRRASPRTQVPAGSVAIAGGQTGVYPLETPGGWNIIGRTPAKPYDPARAEPFMFHPGDQVSFRSIDRAEFHRLIDRLRPERGAKSPSEREREPSAGASATARAPALGVGPQRRDKRWGPASRKS